MIHVRTRVGSALGELRERFGGRPLFLASVIASFATALVTYVASAPSYPASWDTAEMQTVPWILGIAHPTGFPLFTLLGWIFTHALPAGSVAWRMNILCGLCIATASATVCATALTLGAGALEAFLSTLLFTWCRACWNKGSHTDPHAMSLMFAVFVLFFAVRYGRRGEPADLTLSCLSGGLGLATHPETLYVLPAIAVAFVTRRPPTPRALSFAALALLAPLVLYAYLPLRSSVVVAQGLDPLARPPISGAAMSVWDTNRPSTREGFLAEVSGSQFGASNSVLKLFDVTQYPAAGAHWWLRANEQLPLVTFGLALAGGLALVIRDPRSAATLAAGTLAIVPFAYAYKGVEGDINRYLLTSFGAAAIFAALSTRLEIVGFNRALRSIVAIVLLMAAATAQWNANSSAFGGRLDPGGQPTIDAVLRSIPDGAIVVAGWVDGTSLQYAAYVDGSMGSRLIVAGWPGEFKDAYRAWSEQRAVYIFADPNVLANARDQLPQAWLTVANGSDAYHRIFRVLPTGAR